MTLAATKHVLWALNTPKMRLRPRPARERIFGIFRAQVRCLVAGNVLFLLNVIYKSKQMWFFLNALYVSV